MLLLGLGTLIPQPRRIARAGPWHGGGLLEGAVLVPGEGGTAGGAGMQRRGQLGASRGREYVQTGMGI